MIERGISRSLGTSTLLINVRKGLDDLVSRLEADAKRAADDLRADILFPVDRMRNVNRGRLLDTVADFGHRHAAQTVHQPDHACRFAHHCVPANSR